MTTTALSVVSRSPQRPETVVAEAAAASPGAVHDVVARARAAGSAWRAENALTRAGLLSRAADRVAAAAGELEDLIVVEVGKPRTEARGEVARAVAILHYFAQQVLDPAGAVYPPSAGGLLYTERRPLGVAGLITPWNFPVAIPLWKAAPALAAGNTVVLKPSTDGLACAQELERVLGGVLPDDVFTVVPGERDAAVALIDAVDVVSFTGSTAVGRQVVAQAAGRAIPVQAEMGGQNAAIVLPDADLDATAAMLAPAAMGYAGQKCTATRRIVVVGDPGPLTEALTAAVAALAVGDPDAEATVVGPLIGAAAREKLISAVDDARHSGGRLLAGGDVPAGDGWFAPPTLIDALPAEHRVAQEETFAPLAVVLAADTLDEAVVVANAVGHGLVTSVHGRDLEQILRAVGAIDTGMIKVNAPTTGVDFHAPFGGEKDSSAGPREQGKAAIDFYTSTRTVTLAPGP